MQKHKETIYQYHTVFNPNGAGYTVTVPKLPGLVTEGVSLAEARRMAKDAIRCHIEGILKDTPSFSKRAEKARTPLAWLDRVCGYAIMPVELKPILPFGSKTSAA